MNRKTIAVFGSSAPRKGDNQYEFAYNIGYQLAVAGFDLINGGHDGTMEASACGTREGGGFVTGVTCRDIRKSRGAGANPYLNRVIETDTLLQRINLLLVGAGGYVFLPGGTGTLAEFGLAWEFINKNLIAERPIVCVGQNWSTIVNAVASNQPGADTYIVVHDDVGDIVKTMCEQAVCIDVSI